MAGPCDQAVGAYVKRSLLTLFYHKLFQLSDIPKFLGLPIVGASTSIAVPSAKQVPFLRRIVVIFEMGTVVAQLHIVEVLQLAAFDG